MSNNGVQFERDIVDCYINRNFNRHSAVVVSATQHLIRQFPDGEIVHRDDISLKGMGLGREIKADFWINGHGVSVKLDGPVQLSSAEGKRTAAILDKVQSQLSEEESLLLSPLISQVATLPRVMIAESNREKALSRKPHLVPQALDYDIWKQIERPKLNEHMRAVFQSSPIKEAVVEEMLTGRLQFAGTIGIADYILTPKYFQYIDKKYVQKVAQYVKIDTRGKSRAGISSGVVRFDITV